MGTVIDKTTIEKNAYDNIYEVMNNRSNIQDPRETGNTGTSGRDFILNSEPVWKSYDCSLMPFIILEFPTVEYVTEENSNDGRYKRIKWTHKIMVRVARTGSNNRSPNDGKKDYLNICSDLHKTFNSISIRTSLGLLNIRKVDFKKIGHDEVPIDNNIIYEAEFELSYETRMKVSD